MENSNVDDFQLSDLGVIVKGHFNSSGVLEGWSIDTRELNSELSRQLLDQPVIHISDKGGVFLRGLYSKKLTEERQTAMQ
jgi:hypothetical protein